MGAGSSDSRTFYARAVRRISANVEAGRLRTGNEAGGPRKTGRAGPTTMEEDLNHAHLRPRLPRRRCSVPHCSPGPAGRSARPRRRSRSPRRTAEIEADRRQGDDPQRLPRRRPRSGDLGQRRRPPSPRRPGRSSAKSPPTTSRSGPRASPRRSSRRNRTWSACRRSPSGGPARPSLEPLLGGSPPKATTVRYDYLAELLKQLNKGKERYRAAVVNPSSTSKRPPTRTASPATARTR